MRYILKKKNSTINRLFKRPLGLGELKEYLNFNINDFIDVELSSVAYIYLVK